MTSFPCSLSSFKLSLGLLSGLSIALFLNTGASSSSSSSRSEPLTSVNIPSSLLEKEPQLPILLGVSSSFFFVKQ
jgi:hypothetical protein